MYKAISENLENLRKEIEALDSKVVDLCKNRGIISVSMLKFISYILIGNSVLILASTLLALSVSSLVIVFFLIFVSNAVIGILIRLSIK